MAKKETAKDAPVELAKQMCPVCSQNTLTLRESEQEIPYFGWVYLFSMTCSNCHYHKSDIEAAEKKEPCRYTFEVNGKDDLNVRIVKSAEATLKIPHIVTVESSHGSEGYISNVEGVIERVKKVIEMAKEDEEDLSAKKKAKNLLKKLMKVLWGTESIKIIIEDPTGNSAILSERAVKTKL